MMPLLPCALHVFSHLSRRTRSPSPHPHVAFLSPIPHPCTSHVATMHRLLRFASLILALQSVAALPSHPRTLPACSAPVIVHQFAPGTALENQRVRSVQGDILVTLITSPQVYLIDPNGVNAPLLVATFPNAKSLADIVEVQPNIFYVGTSNITLSPPGLTLFASAIWKLDLSRPTASGQGIITKIADVPQVGLVDGMAVLNPSTLLLADIWLGVVWGFNINSGTTYLAINDTTMQAPYTANAINGIQLSGSTLLYTNTAKNTFNKIGIDRGSGHATSAGLVLATEPNWQPDDFAVDALGNVFLASHLGQVDGLAAAATASPWIPIQVLAQVQAQAPNSVAFGSRAVDVKRKSVYVTSNGFTNGAIDLSLPAYLYRFDGC